jgi:acetyltransferase-like isoleucine patch superfamily enzyme
VISELPVRPPAELETAGDGGRLKLVAVRVLQYLTNHVISVLPSFTVRRLWYERVLGARIGPGAGIHLGCHLWFYGPGQVRRGGFALGRHSRVNRDCRLDVRGSLQIGENVSISPEVTILTASHGVNDPLFRVEVRPVVVDDHVWIGTRAMIMPGVTLGRGSVVAAGAVVTRSVPPLTVVAGVPAKAVAARDDTATTYVLDGRFPLFD